MNNIEKFEEEKCKNCKNNHKKNIDICEIRVSRYDGRLYCPNYEKRLTKKL